MALRSSPRIVPKQPIGSLRDSPAVLEARDYCVSRIHLVSPAHNVCGAILRGNTLNPAISKSNLGDSATGDWLCAADARLFGEKHLKRRVWSRFDCWDQEPEDTR